MLDGPELRAEVERRRKEQLLAVLQAFVRVVH